MLRTALISSFCSLALVATASSQDVFVPRELKAQAVHPEALKEQSAETKATKSKEVVRRAEPVTEAELKAPAKAPKAEAVTPKTEKTSQKEKPAVIVKSEKAAPVSKEDSAKKSVAKADSPKVELPREKTEKPAAPKDKPAATTAKTQPAADDLPTIKVEKATVAKEAPVTKAVAKTETVKAEPKEKAVSEPPTIKVEKTTAARDTVKVETVTAKTQKPQDKSATVAAAKPQKDEKIVSVKEETTKKPVAKTETAKAEPVIAKSDKAAAIKDKEKTTSPAKPSVSKPETLTAKVESPAEGPATAAKPPILKAEQISAPSQKDAPPIIPAMSSSLDSGFTKIADGFDFPVGKPEAEGYYKARGFRPHGHLGEDWDGVRGGDTDLRDPIYSIGDGIVVFARDVHLGWGNVIIVRHAFRENGTVKYIDALYGHLNTMLVGRGQRVGRGQQIATMGTAHGQYDAHLHFEIRKNLEIGMSRAKFQKDFSNYYDPSQFIATHRRLSGGGANYKVAMNTFTQDWAYHFDRNRNFAPRKRGTGESSAALRRALTSR